MNDHKLTAVPDSPPVRVHDPRVEALKEVAALAKELEVKPQFVEDVLEAAVDLIITPGPEATPPTNPIGFSLSHTTEGDTHE